MSAIVWYFNLYLTLVISITASGDFMKVLPGRELERPPDQPQGGQDL